MSSSPVRGRATSHDDMRVTLRQRRFSPRENQTRSRRVRRYRSGAERQPQTLGARTIERAERPLDAPADTPSPPSAFYPNVAQVDETGTEAFNDAYYTPTLASPASTLPV